MSLRVALVALVLLGCTAIHAQSPTGLKPTAQGFFLLPNNVHAPVFNSLADVLGQVDGAFQLPFYKGLGVGVGVNATFYELNGRSLAPELTEGSVDRLVFYGKVFWAHATGKRTFMELNAKLGTGTWNWKCSTCRDNQRQTALHWGLNASWFIHATDNLAFGLSLGFQGDESRFSPGVIGLQRFPGRTDTGSPYRFLTFGLGFSTGFEKSGGQGWP